MVRVEFFIQGEALLEADVGGRVLSFIEGQITLDRIKSSFPFEGVFHFRAKIAGGKLGLKGVDWVWADLIDEEDVILLGLNHSAGSIQLQALAIDIPPPPDANEKNSMYISNLTNVYIDGSDAHIPLDRKNSSNSLEVSSSSGSSKQGGRGKTLTDKVKSFAGHVKSNVEIVSQNVAQNVPQHMDMEQVKAGANTLWKSMWSTAEKLQSAATAAAAAAAEAAAGLSADGSGGTAGGLVEGSSASKGAREALGKLSGQVGTVFAPQQQAEHMHLLEELWALQFPEEAEKQQRYGLEFKRESPIWKQVLQRVSYIWNGRQGKARQEGVYDMLFIYVNLHFT